MNAFNYPKGTADPQSPSRREFMAAGLALVAIASMSPHADPAAPARKPETMPRRKLVF